MSWVNYDDALNQLRSAGLIIDSIEVGTHKPVRCKVEGEHEKRGWYWVSDFELADKTGQRQLYIVGSYGVWRGNDNGALKIELPKGDSRPTLSDDERKAIAARQKENAKRAQAMRDAESARAAQEASRVWRAYITTGSSDYLHRKGVGAHGVRFDPNGHGTMAIPMQDTAGRVWALQIIRGKNRGSKLEKEYFPRGMSKQGKFHMIGAVTSGGICLVAEGYATAATLHEATKLPVAVAFDAGNLMPVAQELRKAHKSLHLLVCADDDYATDGNPGVSAARNAATAVSGHWVKPVFNDAQNQTARARIAECVPLPGATGLAGKENTDAKQRVAALLKEIGIDKHTDFNDLQQHPGWGQHTVRMQIEAALKAAGWNAKQHHAPAAAIPQGEGERRRAMSVLWLDEAVERFTPLDDGTGKYLFDGWTSKIVHKDQMLAVLPAGVRLNDVKRHPTWLNRGSYYIDQVGFDPAHEDPNCKLNTWTGWPTTPKKGKCDALIGMLEYLCSNDMDSAVLFGWMLCWLAYPIQHPGAKMQTAVVVHGPQGTGKSRFFESYAKIFGEYAIVLNQGAIEDKFNSDWTSRKLFILADEIVARQDLYHLKNQLKAFITGDWVRVNPKNLAAYKERNHMNMVFLSNDNQPVALERDDRRHCVIWTPEKRENDYYDVLSEEIANGGIEALHHFLLNLDIGDFKPWTKPPMTQAKRELIGINVESMDAFLEEWTNGDMDLPFCPCKSSDLYRAYVTWCKRTGERYPRNDRQFGGHIDKLKGWERTHKDIYASCNYEGKPKRARVVIPSEASHDDAIKNGLRDYRKPLGTKTPAQWMTDCVITFENGLQNGGDA